MLAARELPDEPAVDGAECELAARRARLRVGSRIEQPRQLGAGEIRIEHEPRAPRHFRFVAGGFQFLAQVGGATVLPDDRAADRFAGAAIPEHRGLALIGDADGDDVAGEWPSR